MADVRALLRAERAQRAPPKAQPKQATTQPLDRKRKAEENEIEARKRKKSEERHDLPATPVDDSAENEDEDMQNIELEESITAIDVPQPVAQDTKQTVFVPERPQEASVDEDEW